LVVLTALIFERLEEGVPGIVDDTASQAAID
jgi:hypothetical protein